MGGLLRPTTKAQVTGHAFLNRRVTHGLVLGDIRMIHEPLGARGRGLIFGVCACVIGALGAGALALISPQPTAHGAPIIRSNAGNLYAAIDGTYHPVTNLSSAQLIVGQPATPQPMSDQGLAELRRGLPLGIPDAPNTSIHHDPKLPVPELGVCHHTHRTTVLAVAPGTARPYKNSPFTGPIATGLGELTGLNPTEPRGYNHRDPVPPFLPLGERHGILARGFDAEWLISRTGRAKLPPGDTPQGVAVRHGLRIDPTTPVWTPPEEVLAVVREETPIEIPGIEELIEAEGLIQLARLNDGGVARLTATQVDILSALPIPRRVAQTGELSQLSSSPHVPIPLPSAPVEFINPEGFAVCVHNTTMTATPHQDVASPNTDSSTPDPSHTKTSSNTPRKAPDGQDTPGARDKEVVQGVNEQASRGDFVAAQPQVGVRALPMPQGVEVRGGAQASRYIGPGRSILLDTGGGWWVLSDTGRVHAVHTPEDAAALGWDPEGGNPGIPADYAMVRLLPEGPALSREDAARPRY